jgi:hydroxymethylbilane synthase
LGDTNKTTDLHTLASTGKSLWTEDLEVELREGRVDVIVHSMKDVPTQVASEFAVAAIGARDEPRDAVVMSTTNQAKGWRLLKDLPEGGVVGTSSVRRAAMVRRTYPHLVIQDVRGNVGTRLRKLDDESLGFDALVLAGAGVQRLGLGDRVSSWLGSEEGVLHAVGQGALGVEWRAGDEWVAQLLEGIGRGKESRRVRWECVAERSLLRALEGGCSVPVGVQCAWEDARLSEDASAADGEDYQHQHTDTENAGYENDDAIPAPTVPETATDGGVLTLRAMVVSLDGKECVEGLRRGFVGSDREAEEVAMGMYGSLVEGGAERILKKITLNRGMIGARDGA